jgi:CheY-like chemotaxis protein
LVEDAGTGMDERVRARALEPFFSTRDPGRLGLGLPVAQAVVAHHGGTLDLVSVPEVGTTVRLCFPTAGGTTRTFASAARRATVARVLVVEDDAAVREALGAVLGQEGHVVLEAADGPGALEAVRREPVDVALVDLDLAGMSGLEVARQVKRVQPRARIVLVTGWPGRLDDATLTEAGVDRVIEKPVGVGEVLSALDAVLVLRPTVQP